MARDFVDVQRLADAYKKDGHKVSEVKIVKPGHYQFKRTSPDGRNFLHSYSPKGSKMESRPGETPVGVDPADHDDSRSEAAPVKRGRGRPKGSKSGAR